MNELKEHIQSISEVLKGECAKIAFWKENKHWYSYIFELTKNSVLTEFSKQFLENIQKNDPKAVVVDSGDFIEANGDGSILVDNMAGSVLYLYSVGQANISDFLEIHTDKKQQQKVDRSSLKEVVQHCWDRLWKERYSNAVFWKENRTLKYYMFCLINNILSKEDEIILRKIKEKDCSAVIIDKNDYSHSNEYAIPILIETDIFKYCKTKNTPHNIGIFLDKYSWSAVVDKNKEKQQEEQQRHWTMERSEIVEIMERELKKIKRFEHTVYCFR